jgi:hypothetical protein
MAACRPGHRDRSQRPNVRLSIMAPYQTGYGKLIPMHCSLDSDLFYLSNVPGRARDEIVRLSCLESYFGQRGCAAASGSAQRPKNEQIGRGKQYRQSEPGRSDDRQVDERNLRQDA